MADLPFDHPDIKAVFEAVFGVLVIESDRGAVLVGAELISDNLKALLQDVFPQDFKAREFLSYPGPLSSAAARAEASYGFRLISKNIYRAITLLRRVRNAAAHSPAAFSLEAHADRLREVYEETVTPRESVDHVARRFMVFRLAAILHEVDSQLGMPPRTYSEEDYDEMLGRPEIAQHLPKYQLAVAVSLICALIVYHRNQLLSALGEGTLMAQILRPQEHSSGADKGEANETAPNPATPADA